LNYPAARSKALAVFLSSEVDGDYDYSSIVSKSNNILGIEYCKSLLRNNSKINLILLKE
jgi:Protein of unknown function (DUF795).